MAFEKSSNSSSGNIKWGKKYADCDAGEVLAEGFLTKIIQDQYGNPCYLVKGDDGVVTGLNSSGHLNYLMEQDAYVGACIQVVYEGTEIMEKGRFKGKPAHRFSLLIDRERSSTKMQSSENSEPQMDAETAPKTGLGSRMIEESSDDVLAKYRRTQ